MRILVTGSKGQLGMELVRQASLHEVVATSRETLDITDLSAVRSILDKTHPEVVINAAAYTSVDKAEADHDAAFTVNCDGPANLAVCCAEMDIPLFHISTDYVFDGTKKGSYSEGDPIAPLGVYGESKAAGESMLREHCSRHIILRTSWVFSVHGCNFVKTMLRLGAERAALGVVADQFGKPTSASELARLILKIIPYAGDHWGTYHLAQPEAVSWHGFAEAIFKEAACQGKQLMIKNVNPIATEDYPTPARRPANSVLNCDRFEEVFGVEIRPWRELLVDVVRG